jgi:hypothetical protein
MASALLFSFLPSPFGVVLAQETRPDLIPPPSWQVRLDRPQQASVEDVWYVDMPPGWHITTGPAAIFWDPANQASGEYRLESEIFLFDPGERREGFGVFLGGMELRASTQAYVYFLLREGGEFIVKTRRGDETETVIPWTAHPAIASWADRGPDAATAKNVLAVEVGAAQLRFFVNDVEVAALPTDGPSTAGVFGLRVNHNVNIHVTNLEVQRKN